MIGRYPPLADGCYSIPATPGVGMTLDHAVVNTHRWCTLALEMIRNLELN
jgi:hypothetical protein